METNPRRGPPLRHRMVDDLRIRKFAEHTQDGHIRAVRKLAAFLGRSPDAATIEDLRRSQPHLVDAGTGPMKGHSLTRPTIGLETIGRRSGTETVRKERVMSSPRLSWRRAQPMNNVVSPP